MNFFTPFQQQLLSTLKIGGGGGKKKKKQQASKFKQVRVRVEDRTTTHQGTYLQPTIGTCPLSISINSLASGIPTKLQHLISIHQPSTTNSISDSVQIYQANPISFNAFFSFSSRTESIANQTISYEPQQHVLQNTPKYHDNHHYKYRYLLSNSRSNRPANKTQHTPKPPTKKPLN